MAYHSCIWHERDRAGEKKWLSFIIGSTEEGTGTEVLSLLVKKPLFSFHIASFITME